MRSLSESGWMLDRLIAASPYAGLYLALGLGGMGFPIPEEVPVLTAGVLAHKGVVRWWLALLVCVAGVATGDLVLYMTGRRWGERVLDVRLVRRFLDVDRRNAWRPPIGAMACSSSSRRGT